MAAKRFPARTRRHHAGTRHIPARDPQQRGLPDGGAPLQPTGAATTVRVRGGKTMITDGPFAETKEQLAGFYILNCKDLDEAIELASKVPDALTGSIEIHPVIDF